MILDPDTFLSAYAKWQSGDDNSGELVELLRPLAEVIASSYSNDSEYRQDLIQECLSRAYKALDNYDPTMANPHKYFTSVFHNRCRTCIDKWHKVPMFEEFDDLYIELYAKEVHNSDKASLVDLLTRNRNRFSSIEADKLDRITTYMYNYIVTGILPGNGRGVIKTAIQTFNISRTEATVLYYSSLSWLRTQNIDKTYYGFDEPDELSILYDLREIVGDDAYEVMSTLFAGISIKFPSNG